LDAVAPVALRSSARLFFSVAFAVTWILWLFPMLASHEPLSISRTMQLICLFAGSFGPFVGAILAVGRDGGWSAVRAFARRSLRARFGTLYWLSALFLMPALACIAVWWRTRSGGPPDTMLVNLAQLPLLYLQLFFIGGSVNEEFGWAYAIDQLQRRHRLLIASAIMGVIWGCWHIPLFFVVGLTQSFMPFWAFLTFTVAFRILIVWAYESSHKSILVALLFHTGSNLSFNLYELIDRTPHHDESAFVRYCLLTALVAGIVALTARCYRSAA